MIENIGTRTARDVVVRTGSASTPGNKDRIERAAQVAPGETIPIIIAPTFGGPGDYAVVITWRGRFGRQKQWTHRTH